MHLELALHASDSADLYGLGHDGCSHDGYSQFVNDEFSYHRLGQIWDRAMSFDREMISCHAMTAEQTITADHEMTLRHEMSLCHVKIVGQRTAIDQAMAVDP